MKKQLSIALVLALVVTISAVVPTALAKNNEPKPGWGFGDTNKVHVGPPGQSVRPNNEKIVKKLEKQQDKIVNKLEKNNKIPEPQKSNLISDIKSIFDKLISFFS